MLSAANFIPVARQKTPCATKNDALGWVVGATWVYRRLRIGLRTNDQAVWPVLQSMLPPDATPSDQGDVDLLMSLLVGKKPSRPGVKNYHLVYMAWQRMARTLDLPEALDRFQQVLSSLVVSLTPGGTFFFFRAVRLGEQVALLALEGAEDDSKELLAAFEAAGCELLPDEYFEALVGPLVRPYRRTETYTPALFLMVSRKPGVQWRPRKLTPGRASVRLIPFAPGWEYGSERVLVWLSRLTSSAPAYRSPWSDPDPVVGFVKQRLERAQPRQAHS